MRNCTQGASRGAAETTHVKLVYEFIDGRLVAGDVFGRERHGSKPFEKRYLIWESKLDRWLMQATSRVVNLVNIPARLAGAGFALLSNLDRGSPTRGVSNNLFCAPYL